MAGSSIMAAAVGGRIFLSRIRDVDEPFHRKKINTRRRRAKLTHAIRNPLNVRRKSMGSLLDHLLVLILLRPSNVRLDNVCKDHGRKYE
jgi:hypothetical protein